MRSRGDRFLLALKQPRESSSGQGTSDSPPASPSLQTAHAVQSSHDHGARIRARSRSVLNAAGVDLNPVGDPLGQTRPTQAGRVTQLEITRRSDARSAFLDPEIRQTAVCAPTRRPRPGIPGRWFTESSAWSRNDHGIRASAIG